MFRRSKLIFEICLALFPTVLSQAPQDPIRDFCRRYGHQTALMNSKLYIDGGYVTANPMAQSPDAVINEGLLYQDILILENGMPELFDNLTKNSTIPDVAGGILWTDDVNEILMNGYLFGGEYSDVPQPFSFWGYDTALNQWNETAPPPSSNSIPNWVAWGAGTTISPRGEGYYYGGYSTNRTTPGWSGPPWATSSLLKYDMINNFWTNNSGPDSIGRAEGVMVSIPASKQGLLVYFGGVTFPYENTTEVAALMSEINVFDVAESKWYLQNAGGDIPDPRRKFCAGAAWPADRSSYNIYLYGGAGFGMNATGFDDVYILSMPSFQWIKWWPTTPDTGHPHNSLSCNVVDNAQMLIIGGTFTLPGDSDMCDAPVVWGTHNLDLCSKPANATPWQTFNLSLNEYTVPSEIVDIIGGSSSGGAAKTAPALGWGANVDLSVYFTETAAYTARTPTRSFPTATGIPRPGDEKDAAVIGGAVGGSIGALVLALAILFCWVRHRRQSLPQLTSIMSGAQQGHPPSEMQGQVTQPTELPTRNSAIIDAYQSPKPDMTSEHKVLPHKGSSSPASLGSPCQSLPNHSLCSTSTTTVPVPFFETRVGSPVYQHPAHQPLRSQEYFLPPPGRTDEFSWSTLARPHTAHGRSHELPASRSPAVVPGRVEEMPTENTESASRSTDSHT